MKFDKVYRRENGTFVMIGEWERETSLRFNDRFVYGNIRSVCNAEDCTEYQRGDYFYKGSEFDSLCRNLKETKYNNGTFAVIIEGYIPELYDLEKLDLPENSVIVAYKK